MRGGRDQNILAYQRQKYHVRIRRSHKQQAQKQLEKHRFEFIITHTSEFQRLKNIDCFKCIKEIKAATNYFNVMKQIEDIFVYSVGKQSDHMFGIFDKQIIKKFIEIGKWTFEIEYKFATLKDKIQSIRRKILWISANYLNYKNIDIVNYQFLDMLNLFVIEQDPESFSIIFQILEKSRNVELFLKTFLHHQIFQQILSRHSLVTVKEFSQFAKNIFLYLTVHEYYESSEISRLINILMENLQKAEKDNDMNEFVAALLSFFNQQICENQRVIVQNKNILYVCGIWLLQKQSLCTQKSICINILGVFEIIFGQSFDSEQYIDTLKNLIFNYFNPMCEIIFHKPTYYQLRFFEILSDACANCDLIPFIVKQDNLMQAILLQYGLEPQGNSKASNVQRIIQLCVTNLVLTGQIEDLHMYHSKILQSIVNALGAYDSKIHIFQLKALIELFDFGQKLRSNKFSSNIMIDKFRNNMGIEKLNMLQYIDNNPKIEKLISKILDNFLEQTDHE